MIQIPYYETSHFVFSNFSAHTVIYKGVLYPTVEHAFHIAKFDDEKIRQEILSAGSPIEAFELGQKYRPMRRNDWEDIRVEILFEIIKEKVSQHQEVKDALLATGDEEIVEHNPNDSFWGTGTDRKGENNTGKIYMRIREGIR